MGKTLHLKSTGQLLLRLTDAQLADLQGALEEESTTDRDYYIDDTTLGLLEDRGADAQLVKALRRALENKRTAYRDPATPEPTQADDDEGDGIDVEWRETEESA
jgi:hypothetical protein